MVNEHILILWHCFENMEILFSMTFNFLLQVLSENVFLFFSNICPKSLWKEFEYLSVCGFS